MRVMQLFGTTLRRYQGGLTIVTPSFPLNPVPADGICVQCGGDYSAGMERCPWCGSQLVRFMNGKEYPVRYVSRSGRDNELAETINLFILKHPNKTSYLKQRRFYNKAETRWTYVVETKEYREVYTLIDGFWRNVSEHLADDKEYLGKCWGVYILKDIFNKGLRL